MRVVDLRQILETLDDDMLITVNGRHVSGVERRLTSRGMPVLNREECGECGESSLVQTATFDQPPSFSIESYPTVTSRGLMPGRDEEPQLSARGRMSAALRTTVDAANKRITDEAMP